MTIVAMRLIDRVGRRPLLLVGIAGMIISLGVLGFVFRTHEPSTALGWLAMIILMAYVASFAISLGPIFGLLIAEIYPLKIRGIAEGTAAGSNWAANLLVSITFLSLVQALGPSWTFWLYGLLAIATWIFSYYLVPETKGRTLEEIEQTWRSGRSYLFSRNDARHNTFSEGGAGLRKGTSEAQASPGLGYLRSHDAR
jgi:MFS transporter, SP family, galactose:H+ symporter